MIRIELEERLFPQGYCIKVLLRILKVSDKMFPSAEKGRPDVFM